ncbi:ABC transporter permease [Rhodoferax sp. BLA1]|uniref:ABC transporter permease n=1 Tax=Rhodoferax sp. BLA1 TaxID=2576062 RepID=UPI0015D1DD47|nr:ABC transporter permease [Rhodoferax sp. BLA1]
MTSFWRTLVNSARREARRLRTCPWDLSMVSWVPLLACTVMAWIFSAGLPQQLPIGLMDQDHSALSRQLGRFLAATPGLKLVASYDDTAQATQALRRTEVYAVVSIPADFSRQIKLGQAAQVTLLHNAQLGTHSGLIQRDVRTAVATLSAGVEMSARNKRGQPALLTRVAMEPIQTQLVTLFNVSLNYEQFLAAALIPALLHILAMTAGAWAVGRELRDATLGQWLGDSPGWSSASAALLGKLAWPFISLGLVGTASLLGLTWGRGWFPTGSLACVLLALLGLLALSLAMGAAVAAGTLSLRTALSATGFITAPAFAFSGVGFPLQSMPVLARGWAELLPYTHYIRLQMEQLQMGAPLRYSSLGLAGLWLATTVLGALSAQLLVRAARQPERWGGR